MAPCNHRRSISEHEAPYDKQEVQTFEFTLQFPPYTTIHFKVTTKNCQMEMEATPGAENLRCEVWVKDKRGDKMSDANRKLVEVGRPCRIQNPLDNDRLCWRVWEKACAICEPQNKAGSPVDASQKLPEKPSPLQAEVQESQPSASGQPPPTHPLQLVQGTNNAAELDALKAENAMLRAKNFELERRNADFLYGVRVDGLADELRGLFVVVR
ncbi:hypothetical protein M3Y99_01011700 [Aphelenchoides fujianensis]|nr:hypothetical protein M3Y99_01011700 [Aphelenchoides fujianensis]